MKILSRNFLYNILTIFVLFSLLMVMDTCTKDEIVPIDKFNIIKTEYTATGKTVNINCKYYYPGIIQRAVIHYSKDSLLTNDLKSAQCTVEDNQYLKVNIDNLQALTTYYGYYEVDNGIEKHKTETIVFKTKNYTPTTVTTNAATNISFNKATLHGVISDDGELSIVERGFCLSKTYSNPTISDTHYAVGSGTGSFSKTATELNTNTTYHYRAYAKNSNNEYIYGNICHFTTTDGKPTVTTVSANATSSSMVTGVGNVTNNGGSTVTARGFCWSTNSNPTINNSHTTDGTGTGTFNSYISGLSANTTYYMRAYAQNANGVSYGEVVSVYTTTSTCPSTVTDYDGNSYSTVLIGTQCWMKQNLKTTHYQTGGYISLITDASSWSSLTSAARCYPNGGSSNFSSYGYLYNWYAVNGGNLCPSGWHVPTDQDFTTLENYLGTNAGGAMKYPGTVYWSSPNTGATNSSGFSAYGAGYRNMGGTYNSWHESGMFWSSTLFSYNDFYALAITLSYNDSYIDDGLAYSKCSGASVRCLKN
ncbi:MAG: fibrobacter succinogenes major paralogous domain-containing protein [Bacteroidales bacterium]|nr:fibrobacter succinogenes major paralogous domain-containing protein [Bacteroidales bacterium]